MTRSAALALLGLAVSCRGGTSQGTVRFDGAQALRWVEYQVAAGPRIPNTAPHRAIAAWIEAQLRRRADSVEVQAFTHVTEAGDTLQLRNLIGRFRPSDPNRVLFLAHWD
jgi:glutaminyl-peptide cyclotransferase